MAVRQAVTSSYLRKIANVASQRYLSSSAKPKVVVFGGNGFVGQRVCESALKLGAAVIAVNRSGAPKQAKHWAPEVQWVKGDALKPETYREALQGATGVVSCVGAFGSNQTMERINGDANVAIATHAKTAGVKNFAFVSAVESNLPKAFLHGYFDGKHRTEEVVMAEFPSTGAILRPSAIYGTRDVGSMNVPLGWVLKPLRFLFRLPPFPLLRNTVPGFKALLAPPVSVDDVGIVAAAAAIGKASSGILTEADIERTAKELTLKTLLKT